MISFEKIDYNGWREEREEERKTFLFLLKSSLRDIREESVKRTRSWKGRKTCNPYYDCFWCSPFSLCSFWTPVLGHKRRIWMMRRIKGGGKIEEEEDEGWLNLLSILRLTTKTLWVVRRSGGNSWRTVWISFSWDIREVISYNSR